MEYKKELTELEKELSLFEAKYGMDSLQFFNDFESGKLGDSIDFIEWSSLCKIHQRVLERKIFLKKNEIEKSIGD